MISVCMATYNGEKYIEEQLQSVLRQLGKNDEIVISDDGSCDDTNYGFLFWQNLQKGLAKNNREGIELSFSNTALQRGICNA